MPCRLQGKYAVVAEDICRGEDGKPLGRNDISIEGTLAGGQRFLLVIEAKVDASEGEDQLGRYDRAIDARARQLRCSADWIRRIFLVPGEREAHSESAGWQRLDYENLVRALLQPAETLRGKPGHPFYRLYIATIL